MSGCLHAFYYNEELGCWACSTCTETISAEVPRDWQDRALCAETDPDLFFPDGRGDFSVRDAKRVCVACEVRAECLAYALEHPELEGVWGGLSEHERRGPRRQLRRAA